jgi:hypothetical protein
MSTPPKPGARPSVRVDQQLSDDLAALMIDGGTVSDAVRQAVAVVANAYRHAWATGRVPEGMAPIVGGCVLRCPTPDEQRRTRRDQHSQTPIPGPATASDAPRPGRPTKPEPVSDTPASARPTPPAEPS